MSCCRNKNYYSRAYNHCCDYDNADKGCCNRRNDDYDNYNDYNNYDDCDDYDSRSDYNNHNDLTGISCPFHNNNDCCCARSLRDAACKLTNQRVIIYTDNCKMCVVIISVGECFIKTVNPCTQKIVYFNLNRINNIEDVLPRCY